MSGDRQWADDVEPDPEVLADLRLRAASERDSRRNRQEPSWSPPKIVGVWSCRNSNCRRHAEVTEETQERLDVFNAELGRRGEPALDPTKILYCDECLAEFKRTAGDRRRAQVDRMAVAIRQLKESDEPERERALLEQLATWGHPDVEGLVKVIGERKAAERGSKSKRRSL